MSAVAVVTILALTACGGPSSYALRADLCEVLDYQAFSQWFGEVRAERGGGATAAKVTCVARDSNTTQAHLVTLIDAFKYDSAEEAKKVFDRSAKNKSNMDAELDNSVDDARYYKENKDYTVLVLDSDLYLKVQVHPDVADGQPYSTELPRLAAELTDQVLDRLREKS